MHKIIYLFLLTFLFQSCQQSQKIGFVDNSKLINDYQEKKDIENRMKAKIEAFQKRTDSLQKMFTLEVNDAEIKARNMSKAKVQKLSQDLQQREQILTQRLQLEQQQISEESKTKTDSLIKKVKSFVAEYGKTNGYSYILGSNEAGSVMYGEDTNDLTKAILEALNEAYKKE